MIGATASLLWAACRLEPDPAEIRAALAAGPDLDAATDRAIVQRVSPLLWRALETVGDVPDTPTIDRVRRDAVRCRAHALLVLPRVGDAILRPLVDAGHEPLVMKGAALAARYPAVGLRPMDDIDVLLPVEQHAAAIKVLEAAGWRLMPPRPPAPESVLVHPALPGLPLELHHRLAIWQEKTNRVTAEHLWARRVPTTIEGAPAFGLTPEDELVSVIAHAAKPYHTFSRLLWIVDIAVICAAAEAAGRPVDWDVVAARADETACRTAVAVALTQAARIGVDSPAELRRPHATGIRLAALESMMSPDWPAREPETRPRQHIRYALVDTTGYRLRLLVGSSTLEGLVHAPRRAVTTAARLARRWLRLRRSARLAGGQGFNDRV